LLRTIPLRIEYRRRINTPSLETDSGRRKYRTANGETVHISTGIERIELSLDELNVCLEWDEQAPIWDIGLSRPGRDFGSTNKKMDVHVKTSPTLAESLPAQSPKFSAPKLPTMNSKPPTKPIRPVPAAGSRQPPLRPSSPSSGQNPSSKTGVRR